MNTYYNYILPTILLIAGCIACTSDTDDIVAGKGQSAKVIATIGNSVETKADLISDDQISYSKFALNDMIGFYATGGLSATNAKLTYTAGGSFLADGNEDALKWTDGDASGIYSYFPYSEKDQAVNIWREEKPGFWNAGFEDFLATSSSSNVPNGTLVELNYKHQFAMLVIQRGYGFDANTDNIKNSDVTVTLNTKVGKTGKITGTGTGRKLTLIKDNAGVSKLTANKGTYDSKECWYVLIPLGNIEGEPAGKVNTASITLRNNAGVDITIPYSKNYQANYKYLVVANMRDDQAVIETEEIIRWDEEVITIEKPKGIENEDHFTEWLTAYNSSPKDGTVLACYGDKDQSTNAWTFRLLEDIQITKWNSALTASVVVTTFGQGDTFDGQGHTITGIKLKGTGSAIGFFGTLNGAVKNLRLANTSIEGGENTGAIAGSSTGTISNCHIEGYSMIMGTNNVGGLVGNNSGSIDKCSSSATVSGNTNIHLLVGTGSVATNSTSSGTVITTTP